MTGWVVTLAYCAGLCGCGWFWIDALVPERPPRVAHAGLGFLAGTALVTLAMLFLAFAGVPITRLSVVGCVAVVAVSGRVAGRRRPAGHRRMRGLVPGPHRPARPFLAMTAVTLLVGLAVALVTGPVNHIDFIRAWGVKGLAVFAEHRLDFSLISAHWRFYPLELSNLYAGLYLLLGHADEHLIRLPLALYGVSLAAALWWLCRLLMPPAPAWLAVALTVTTPVFLASLTLGLADAAVACYITIAAVVAFLWVREGAAGWAAMSGFAAGAAAWSKLEGAPTGLVILAGALLAARTGRARGAALWLGWFGVFVVPWQVYQRLHHLPFARAHFRHLFLDLPFIGSHVARRLLLPGDWGAFWVACGAILVLSLPYWWRTPWRGLAAVTLPNVLLTAGAYITHYRGAGVAAYQSTTSRLYLHVAPGVAVMTAAAVWATLRPAEHPDVETPPPVARDTGTRPG